METTITTTNGFWTISESYRPVYFGLTAEMHQGPAQLAGYRITHDGDHVGVVESPLLAAAVVAEMIAPR